MKYGFGEYFREGGFQKLMRCIMTVNDWLQKPIPEVLIPGLLRLHVCDGGMQNTVIIGVAAVLLLSGTI